MHRHDPLPALRHLQRAAASAPWIREVARCSADEIECLRALCGRGGRHQVGWAMLVLSAIGALAVLLWVLGALGVIDFHVHVGPPGSRDVR